jgi:hypothetical protein
MVLASPEIGDPEIVGVAGVEFSLVCCGCGCCVLVGAPCFFSPHINENLLGPNSAELARE